MKKSSLAVIGLFFLLYILPLGVRPITIPDEARYAEIPREMIVSGDWVVPHLNGLRYFEKPALGYWANALSLKLFGENAFAIRLPSAIATGISALMLFFLMRRFASGYSAGILAAVAFLTCLEVFGVGTFNVLDSMFSLLLTATMTAFFFAHMENSSRKKSVFLALFGLFCGLAFLTKGFIAFLLPVLAIVPFMIWERRWKELFRIPWLPIVAALLISLPWCVMIYLREHDFWGYFFWIEHIKRFLSDNAQHPEAFWFFIPIVAGGTMPWSFLLPVAITGMRKSCLNDQLARFAICWFLLPFLFFSISRGKLGTYILPCFPPLIILITTGIINYFAEEKKRLFTIGVSFLALVIAVLALTLVMSQTKVFEGLRVYGQAETWKWIIGGGGLLAWSLLLVFTIKTVNYREKLILYCLVPALFMFSAHFIMPDQFKAGAAPGRFLLRHSDMVHPDTILVSDNYLVDSVCWFYRRDDVYLIMKGGELGYGLSYNDSKQRLLTFDQFKKLINKYSGMNHVILIMSAERYEEYRHLMPKPALEDINCGFVFARF